MPGIVNISLFILLLSAVSVPYTAGQLVTAPPEFQGPKGEQGEDGVEGTKGPQGVVGAKGSQGMIGPTGPSGDQGDKGIMGISAPPMGSTGATGLPGDLGATGVTGIKGEVGILGEIGSNGTIGLTGDPGVTGIGGDGGDKGEKGALGERGDQGVTGATGAKGSKGTVGSPGSAGLNGPKGLLGYPFVYDSVLYSDGCQELSLYVGRSCGDSGTLCQDMMTDSDIDGHCGCQDGYFYDSTNGTCVAMVSLDGFRDCSTNNGGCEQTCTNGYCECASGYRLTTQGGCIDNNECVSPTDNDCREKQKCVNLEGSYACVQSSASKGSTGKVVGGPLVNEVVLLVVLIWFLLLLLILIIILIAICCLPPVRLSPSSKTSNHSSEFLMK